MDGPLGDSGDGLTRATRTASGGVAPPRAETMANGECSLGLDSGREEEDWEQRRCVDEENGLLVVIV